MELIYEYLRLFYLHWCFFSSRRSRNSEMVNETLFSNILVENPNQLRFRALQYIRIAANCTEVVFLGCFT